MNWFRGFNKEYIKDLIIPKEKPITKPLWKRIILKLIQ
jgi:hypothetical protein